MDSSNAYSEDCDMINMDEEIEIMRSVITFKKWIVIIHESNPNMTLENYHTIMHSSEKEFTTLKKKIGFGDSFMIEQTNPTKFRCHGKYRLIDYPEIKIPHLGQIVNIKGVEHSIKEYGFLTFNASPCDYDDSTSTDEE